jgi:hypothetical protein
MCYAVFWADNTVDFAASGMHTVALVLCRNHTIIWHINQGLNFVNLDVFSF